MSIESTSFQFDIEADVFEKTNAKGESEYWIGGICTTDHMDQEGERILQNGLDFAPFLNAGYFNDNHGKDTGAAVGRPAKAELRSLPDGHKGWYVEGPLYNSPRAKQIMELANELARSEDNKRKLGFSVEGAVLDRDPNNPSIVRKAIVREVAITRCPVNAHTSLQRLAKSLSVGSAAPPIGVPLTGTNAASILAPQALEEANAFHKRLKKKKMKKSEAIELLIKKQPRLTREGAAAIVDYAIEHGRNI